MISGLLWIDPGDTFSFECNTFGKRHHLDQAAVLCRVLNICPNHGTKPACPKLTSLLIYKHTNRWWGKSSLSITEIIHYTPSALLACISGGDLESFQQAALTNTTLPLWMQHRHNKLGRKKSLCPSIQRWFIHVTWTHHPEHLFFDAYFLFPLLMSSPGFSVCCGIYEPKWFLGAASSISWFGKAFGLLPSFHFTFRWGGAQLKALIRLCASCSFSKSPRAAWEGWNVSVQFSGQIRSNRKSVMPLSTSCFFVQRMLSFRINFYSLSDIKSQ